MQVHIDNAVIDAMLEGAEEGDRLQYPSVLSCHWEAGQGYSWLVGPIWR